MEGRELSLLERLVTATEKSAVAQERLIELATEERDVELEPGPPICPHCGMFNPNITLSREVNNGALAEFVLVAICDNCDRMLFGVPQGWVMARDVQEARMIREGRAGDDDRPT